MKVCLERPDAEVSLRLGWILSLSGEGGEVTDAGEKPGRCTGASGG